MPLAARAAVVTGARRRLPVTQWAGYVLLGITVAVAAAMRTRFFGVPLTTDEGGYGVVAAQWAQGALLYRDIWVDRPQGLVLLFRLVWPAGLVEVRLLAVLATVVTALAVGWVARMVHGRTAALAAASLYLLVSTAPRLSGWAATGELLAGAFTTAGIGCLIAWVTGGRRSGRLLAAGMVLVSVAPLVKQSAVAGLLVALVLVVPYRRAWVPAAAWAGVPWLLAVAHGVAVGFDRWWYAVVWYRLTGARSDEGLAEPGDLFAGSLPEVAVDLAPVLLPAALAAAIAVVRLLRGWHTGWRHGVYAAWLVGGALGVVGGGLFLPHYWLQLLPVAAVAAGALWARMPRLAVPATVVGAVVLAAGWLPFLAAQSPGELASTAAGDPRIAAAPGVGREIAARTGPDDTVLVVLAAASINAYADRAPATPYLWFRPMRYVDGAAKQALDRVAGTDPPAAVAVVQSPDRLDSSGELSRLLARRYREVAVVHGVPVYLLER